MKMLASFALIFFSLGASGFAGDNHAPPKIRTYNSENGRYEVTEKVSKSESEWKKQLTPEQYHVVREKGTEPAFSGKYDKVYEKGTYRCVACGLDLYPSDTKFNSGTGWPSFWKPVAEENIRTEIDGSAFMQRVELQCARCGAHLGHVFDDGPQPTGKRHCINSLSLNFVPEKKA